MDLSRKLSVTITGTDSLECLAITSRFFALDSSELSRYIVSYVPLPPLLFPIALAYHSVNSPSLEE